LTDALRNELHAAGVRVSLIEVGKVSTPLWDKALSTADKMSAALPEAAMRYYTPLIQATVARAAWRGRTGIPPEQVARAIHRALTVRQPQPKYRVGADAHLQALLVWLLPAGLLDQLIRRQVGRS
jgi:short-subunit dehydrogenase